MSLAHTLIMGLGVLLVAVPIVIHMLMRPRPKMLDFPALRFVRVLERTNRQSLRLRHWLLLLMRCLLLLAVAAAFARPSTTSAAFGDWLGAGAGLLASLLCGMLLVYAAIVARPVNLLLAGVIAAALAMSLFWTGTSLLSALGKGPVQGLTSRQEPVAAAIIVDSSPRMQYRYRNRTLLQGAQEEALWIVEQFPPGSKVAVVQNDGQPPFFSVDVGAARKRLNTLETRFASVPIPESIEAAARLLRDAPTQLKEIYVVADMTAASWAYSGNALRSLLEAHPDINLYILDVGVEEPVNFALDQLELSGSSVPEQGTLEATARLRAIGPGGNVVARLLLEKPDPSRPIRRDGKTITPEDHWVRAANVSVAENSATAVTLSLQDQLAPGVHHGWIELEASDSLDIDNRLYFTIEVTPAWKVLVVAPDGVDPGNLVDALDPGDELTGDLFDVKSILQRDLSLELLEDYSAIFLLDPTPVSDATWQSLEAYVSGGGGLGIFAGANAANGDGADQSFQSAAAAGVLPGTLKRIWRGRGATPGSSDVRMSMDTLVHPVLSEFRPYSTLGIWQPFPVYRHWELDHASLPEVEVIARFTNGVAAVLERPLGRGFVICMTTPITEPAWFQDQSRRPWNDLFNSAAAEVWPAWLLTTSIARYLASGTRDRLNLVAGQAATLRNPRETMPAEYRLYPPRDEEPVRVVASDNLIRYKFTDVPGNYRLKGQLEGPVLRGFSTNLPPGATDLQRIDPAQLEQLFGDDRYQLAQHRNELERQQGTARLGQEFYPVLALAMCLLLALELVMSNRFYRK